jgi:A/G-specific adenine glycosylase
MLLLLRNGEVLLEKRAPAGLWGGLWCLPELPPGSEPGDYCLRRFGAQPIDVRRLALLRHDFTHFTLNITPLACSLGSAAPGAAEPGQVWLTVVEAIGAAVPAPVRKLLAGLDSGSLLGEPAALEKALQD